MILNRDRETILDIARKSLRSSLANSLFVFSAAILLVFLSYRPGSLGIESSVYISARVVAGLAAVIQIYSLWSAFVTFRDANATLHSAFDSKTENRASAPEVPTIVGIKAR